MKGPCRDCWDPVDKEGEELCDWCKMTPEQRRKREIRNNILIAVGLIMVMAAMILSIIGD